MASRHSSIAGLRRHLLSASPSLRRSLTRPVALPLLPATNSQTSLSRSYAVARVRKSPSPAEVFNLSEIPLSSFEAVISRNGDAFRRLSPEEYYGAAERFAGAIKSGSSPWEISLRGNDVISPEVLHELACIMRQIHGPRSADGFASAMWASASDMGYRPSILSLSRQLIRSGAFGKVPQLRKVEARFKNLLSTGKDADALTAEGELLFEQGKYDAAVRILQRALQVEQSGFQWKPYCQLCLGKAYAKLQQHDKAQAVLQELSETGLVEADTELGNMLRSRDLDQAEEHYYAAACNGRADMFTPLGEIAVQRAAEAGDKASKEDNRRWALEWSRLADPRVEY